jgi:PKD repeat protein
MKTYTRIFSVLVLALLLVLLTGYNSNAQTTLFTEDWETAAVGQTPPSGWGVDVVSGTVNMIHFLQNGTNPTCLPYSGNRMVEFQSYVYSTGSNRLKRTTPVATTGYPYVTVDFEWHVDTAYSGYPMEGVTIQWSTNGTSWTTAGALFQRSSNSNMWVLETQPLPAGAANQPALYIALLFTSQFGNNCHLDLVHIKGYSSTPPSPTVATTGVTGIQQTSALLHGTVNANGYPTTASFQYGTTLSYGFNAQAGTVTGSSVNSISATAIGLSPGTLYHYRAVGNSAGGTSYGADSIFVSAPAPPTVHTSQATNITNTTASLNDSTMANGANTTTSFEYGLTPSYGFTAAGTPSGFGGSNWVPVTSAITGLTPGTTYHFRGKAVNASGTSYGNDRIFTTTGSGVLPTVITTHAFPVVASNAVLRGNFNANGSTTTAKFDYGLTTSYGTTVTAGTVNGNTLTGMSKQVFGLAPATTYHYRAVGTNSYGTAYGLDTVFTTLDSVPSVETQGATNITTTSATLHGVALANGPSTAVSFDWGLTTTYGSNIGATPGTVSGNTPQSVTAALTGLTPGTTYHYRIKGVNALGTSLGYDTLFTTSGSGSPPTVTTMQATSITATSAALNAHVNANGSSTSVSFEYGLTTAYGGTVSGGTVTGNTMTLVTAPVYGLAPATIYHYRAVGTNANGTTYGNDTTFTTLNAAPSMVTLPSTNINSTSATLNGTANANGLSTTVSFDYGLTASYGSTIAGNPNTVTGNTVQSITAALTGLAAGTTYHYRIKGVNTMGTSYGGDLTFTTLSGGALPPTVVTTGADYITSTYARLNGHVNANGYVTNVSFQYGTTPSYGSTLTAGTASGNTFIVKSAIAYGLLPGTHYHYRIVGSNAGGTAYGADSTFYTSDTLCTVQTLPATSIGTNIATLNGSANPNGGATATSFQYGMTTAYGTTIAAIPPMLYGSGNQNFSKTLSGLLPNQTYHYRAKGVNSYGTVYGVDMTFTTSAGAGCQANMSHSNAGPLTIQFHDISSGGGSYRFWHFGDGGTSTQSDPIHIYPAAGNYTVELFIHNPTSGCLDSTFQVVQVTDTTIGCQAQFTYAPDSLNPNRIHFTDLSIGNISHWLWNFDDDSSSVLQNPVHDFPGPGMYYVCLAIDGPNCLNTSCQEINVGNVPNCISYFTYTHSGLNLNLYGHIVNGLPANYAWSFGDGQTGTGQSVTHQYSVAGVYYVTLTTIDTTHCTYSSGQTVMIGDSAQFLQVYGQVFAGQFPVETGLVGLFSVDTIAPYVPFINMASIDSNGVYYFSMVPQGDFYIYALPFTPEGYVPTFYGDVLYWEDATIIHLGIPDNPYNINLIAAGDMMTGNGSIHGQINATGLKSTDLLGKIAVLLMNSEGKTISYFKADNQGNFVFPSLAYGTYWLKAEIAGVRSDMIMVTLSPSKPQATVIMTFSGNRITGITEAPPVVNTVTIYPNPASDIANISLHLPESTDVSISVLNITGQKVFSLTKKMDAGRSVLSIPVSSLPPGMYTVCIISGNGLHVASKLIR